jgi:visual pigment-like receptor peropsin
MPYAVVSLLESFFNMDLITISPMLVQLPCLMAKTACIWNPLVYVCHNSQFRDAFIDRFKILRRFKKENNERDSEISLDSARTFRVKNQLSQKSNINGNISKV